MFQTFKEVFIPGRAGKNAKVKDSAMRTELVNMRQVDEETHAETWTQSK